MPVTVACGCGQTLRIEVEPAAGREVRCPVCGAALGVPPAGPPTVPPAAAADGGRGEYALADPPDLDFSVLNEGGGPGAKDASHAGPEEQPPGFSPGWSPRPPLPPRALAAGGGRYGDAKADGDAESAAPGHSRPWLVPAVAVVAILLIAAVPFAAQYLLRGRNDPLRWMSNGASMVMVLDVRSLTRSDLYAKAYAAQPALFDEFNAFLKKDMGVGLKDVVTFAVGGDDEETMVTVFITEKRLNIRALGTTIPAGRFTIFDQGNVYVAQVGDYAVIGSRSKAILKKILERDGPPKFVQSIQDGVDLFDRSKTFCMAGDPNRSAASRAISHGGRPTAVVPDSMALCIDVRSDVEVSLALVCRDAKAADEVRNTVAGSASEAKDDQRVPQAVRDTAASLTAKTSDKTVYVTLTVKQQAVMEGLATALPMLKMFGGLPKPGSRSAERE
jgi:hypothetical protein